VYQTGDGASVSDIQVDARQASGSPPDTEAPVVFPDSDMLFTADFRRSGADLLLVGRETTAVVLGYFKDERRPGLTTPDGARLTGETVDALTRPENPGQYAQSSAAAADLRIPIGRVEKVSGSATVLRNGVLIQLYLGDTVSKGDVVQTGSDSSLTIKFNDGTVFGLSSSARMVLNDMVYAADSQSNSALFTLVQGVIGFVAGRIAKTGDLKVDTPVATMAIRGTAVHTEIAAFSGITKFSLLTEPDGTVGSFVLLDPNDPARVITSITDARVATLLTPVAASDPRITQITKSADDLRSESDLVTSLFQFFSSAPQRRGSNGLEDGLIVPAGLQPADRLESLQFAITPFVPELAAAREEALAPLISPPAPLRGTAVEDGPFALLATPTDLLDGRPGTALPLVSVPASLPPGVRYVEATRSFTLNPSHPAYQHLAAGETQTVTVDYSLVVAGSRIPASVSWTVTGSNDAPVVTGAVTGAATEDRSVATLSALGNASDLDASTMLSVVGLPLPLPAGVTYDAAARTFRLNPAAYQHLAAGEQAIVTVNYGVSDRFATIPASVSWAVTGTNDAPVITSTAQVGTITEVADLAVGETSTTLSQSGAVTFADVDTLDTHTAGFVPQEAGYPGTFSLDTSAIDGGHSVGWTYSVADSVLDSLRVGQVLVQRYHVTVADGHGGTRTETVTVTLAGTNDAPVVSGAVTGAVTEGGASSTLSALANASDVDAGTTLSVVEVPTALPAGVTYNAQTQTFTLDPLHADYHALAAGQITTVTVGYGVSDGTATTPASVSWTVTGANDAPVAEDDRIVGVDEADATILGVRSNDRDVDGDALQIVQWTAPVEGSVFLNASGELVFDPGDDFRSLSAGETATVSFSYTVSDPTGGTDTANVTVQVQGEGAYSSPLQTDPASVVLGFNRQPVALTMALPTATTTATANLGLTLDFGLVVQPQMNILYLVDVSGSASGPFAGTPVGDLNGDGSANTVLDAEIASLIALTGRIRGLGFSPADVTVTVIPFNGSANPTDSPGTGVDAATFSLGGAGEQTIANYLRGLDAGGQTNFADALRAANDRLSSLDQGGERNFLYFLSDGNGQGPINAELATLNDVYQARITAVGVGEDASLTQLDAIDNTGGASRLTSPGQLDASVLGSPLPSGTVADLDVFVNGQQIAEIGREDLVQTSEGWALDASIGGLGRLSGDTNNVSATITFVSGEVLTTELTVAGDLPRSTDFIL
jgi:VCBS repeat-containing protein